MYRYLFLLSCFFFANNALASDDLFSGQYSHQYTEDKNDPVWAVTTTSDGFELVYLSDRQKVQLHRLSQDELNQFWEKMWWSVDSNEHAQCIGDNTRFICYVPTESRQEISWIKNNVSDYIYYDSFFGVIEIVRIL